MEKYLIIYGHKDNTSHTKEITWRENNVQVVAKEKCGSSRWNYLSDGTEFDYTLED